MDRTQALTITTAIAAVFGASAPLLHTADAVVYEQEEEGAVLHVHATDSGDDGYVVVYTRRESGGAAAIHMGGGTTRLFGTVTDTDALVLADALQRVTETA